MKKGTLIGALLVLVMAVLPVAALAVPAPLQPDPPASTGPSTEYNPATPSVPTYNLGLPAYCVPGNIPLGGSMVSGIAGGITGQVVSTVYTNPATGFNTFVYEVSCFSGPAIVRASMGGPAWFQVNITDCGADSLGKSTPGNPPAWANGNPFYFDRAGDWGTGMQFLSANQGTKLAPGDTSAKMYFETQYNSFSSATFSVLDGGQSGNGLALAPYQYTPNGHEVPEPGVIALLGFGLAGLVRRKRS